MSLFSTASTLRLRKASIQTASSLRGKTAKLARMSIPGFAAHLSQLNIPVADYDGDELLDELRYFDT